jgi:hypothetical protein
LGIQQIQNRLKLISAKADMQIQQAQMQMQMAMQGQQMQMQQEQQAQAMQAQQAQQQGPPMPQGQLAMAEQQAMARAMAGLPPDEAQAMMQDFGAAQGGQGFNPAMGGTPPAMLSPGATREMINGQARNGEELA